MPKLREVCRHVRSKNAGPFWITVDLFFEGREVFDRYGSHQALGPAAFARLFGVDPGMVRSFAVPSLNVVKVSYPRQNPQGWSGERDMHSGQQFVRLLEIDLD